jgi:phospholipid transport system substrate-binding protein
MRKALIIVAVLTILSTFGYAEQPIDTLQNSIDQSISILTDPVYENDSQKDIQRQKLWEVLKQIFDFKEFSKRVLARNWLKFTPQQREEFVELFGNFVHVYYLSKLQDKYNNEKVILIDQNLISHHKAVVKIKVLWKRQEIPVEVKMFKRDDSWKVYDISALGISAVSFYRSQFQAVLRKETPEHVLEQLKDKIKQSEEKIRQKYGH